MRYEKPSPVSPSSSRLARIFTSEDAMMLWLLPLLRRWCGCLRVWLRLRVLLLLLKSCCCATALTPGDAWASRSRYRYQLPPCSQETTASRIADISPRESIPLTGSRGGSSTIAAFTHAALRSGQCLPVGVITQCRRSQLHAESPNGLLLSGLPFLRSAAAEAGAPPPFRCWRPTPPLPRELLATDIFHNPKTKQAEERRGYGGDKNND